MKFLITITPNGGVSQISPLNGGRTSDIHIVRDSGFLDMLEPFDQVMVDRGFNRLDNEAMSVVYTSISWKGYTNVSQRYKRNIKYCK